jgi:hypothetical protein
MEQVGSRDGLTQCSRDCGRRAQRAKHGAGPAQDCDSCHSIPWVLMGLKGNLGLSHPQGVILQLKYSAVCWSGAVQMEFSVVLCQTQCPQFGEVPGGSFASTSHR